MILGEVCEDPKIPLRTLHSVVLEGRTLKVLLAICFVSHFATVLQARAVVVRSFPRVLFIFDIVVDDLLLHCTCWLLYSCCRSCRSRHATTVSACTNVGALRMRTSRPLIQTFLPITWDAIDTLSCFTHWLFAPVHYHGSSRQFLSHFIVSTPWLFWKLTPHRYILVLPERWFFLFFSVCYVGFFSAPRWPHSVCALSLFYYDKLLFSLLWFGSKSYGRRNAWRLLRAICSSPKVIFTPLDVIRCYSGATLNTRQCLACTSLYPQSKILYS